MEYYIDESTTKLEKQSNGKYIEYIRCGCKLCEKCWFNPKTGHCLYGGPYGGYEEVKNGTE